MPKGVVPKKSKRACELLFNKENDISDKSVKNDASPSARNPRKGRVEISLPENDDKNVPTVSTIDENFHKKMTKEERLSEWISFNAQLPPLIKQVDQTLKCEVSSILNIPALVNEDLKTFDFELLTDESDVMNLTKYSSQHGFSYKILAPPTKDCYLCFKPLTYHHEATQIVVHTTRGPQVYSKYIWRCRSCPATNGESIHYHPDMFGNDQTGWMFYKTNKFIRASGVRYLTKNLVEHYLSDLHHTWASFEGKAESYNECHRDKEQIKLVKEHFTLWGDDEEEKGDTDDLHNLYEEMDDEHRSTTSFNKVFKGVHELSRKTLSSAVWNYLVQCELKDRELTSRYLFIGPLKAALLNFMEEVDDWRKGELYKHNFCNEACKERGCGRLFVADGLWKLVYPICMAIKPDQGREGLQNYIPTNCTNAPKPGHAFCTSHCEDLDKLSIPTKLREFLRHCDTDPNNYTKESKKLVDQKLDHICHLLSSETPSSTEAQGTSYFLRNKKMMKTENFELTDDGDSSCNKETGYLQRLQKWTRGIVAIIRGGGFIESWSPIYKSESPSQVCLIFLAFLCLVLQDTSKDLWKMIFLCYDNMCNVDRLKLLQKPLPLDGDFSEVWLTIQKIIDSVHIHNHKRDSCKQLYSPSLVKEEIPGANMMICEQTFCWCGRYKKIFLSLQKTKFHFLFHRLIKRRNLYTEFCHKEGKYPLLPTPSSSISSKSETTALTSVSDRVSSN